MLCDGSIQHVYLIEEVNSWKRERELVAAWREILTVDSDPLVQVFSLGELDCQFQVPTA